MIFPCSVTELLAFSSPMLLLPVRVQIQSPRPYLLSKFINNSEGSRLPIKCSTERLQQSFSRQACPEQSRRDAKTAKKNIFLFLRTWRPLRLCASHRLSDSLNPNSSENFKYVWLGCMPEVITPRVLPDEGPSGGFEKIKWLQVTRGG